MAAKASKAWHRLAPRLFLAAGSSLYLREHAVHGAVVAYMHRNISGAKEMARVSNDKAAAGRQRRPIYGHRAWGNDYVYTRCVKSNMRKLAAAEVKAMSMLFVAHRRRNMATRKQWHCVCMAFKLSMSYEVS